MVNQLHLKIVKQGSSVVADWTSENPGVGLNLSNANLQGVYLQGADLGGAHLQDTNLQGAHLQGANLQNANLQGARLQGANLQDVNLQWADLQGADLQDADLKNSHVQWADLQRADLQGADLLNADLLGTTIDLEHLLTNVLQGSNLTRTRIANIDNILELINEHSAGSIFRSIEFPPEYHKAGIGILSHFGTILMQKYPDTPINIRVEQEGLRVRLVIDPPSGQREIIEETLEQYGLVIAGKMTPEQFSSDPLEIVQLRSELRYAQARIDEQKDLLQIQSDHSKSQENQIQLLGNLLERSFSQPSGLHEVVAQSREMTKLLNTLVRQLSKQQSRAVEQAFETLQLQLSGNAAEADEPAMTAALDTLKSQAPDVFDQIGGAVRRLYVGVGTGVTGNAAYDMLVRYFGA